MPRFLRAVVAPALALCALGAGLAPCVPTRAYQGPFYNASTNQYPPPPPSTANTADLRPVQTSPPTTGIPHSHAPQGRLNRPPRVAPPACTQDSDCVRASCCHATACVPRARQPRCEGVMCTEECRPGTLDCGGSCGCEGGFCTPRFARE